MSASKPNAEIHHFNRTTAEDLILGFSFPRPMVFRMNKKKKKKNDNGSELGSMLDFGEAF